MIWEYLEVNCEVFNMWIERGNAERIMHMMQKFLKSEYEVWNIWNKNYGCRKFNIHDFLYVFDIRVWSLEYVSWMLGHRKFWTCAAKVFHDSIMSFQYVICKLEKNTESSISVFLNIDTNYVKKSSL